VIWGSVNISGENANVEMNCVDRNGTPWRKVEKSTLTALMGTLQNMTDAINGDVFKRPGMGTEGMARQSVQMNPDFVINETARQTYLNPQFRYQGADGSRQRSQTLDFASVAMEVADVNGDGRNEIVIADENYVRVYRWDEDRMVLLGEHQIPKVLTIISMRVLDMDRSGAADIIVTANRPDYTEAQGFILSFRDNRFTVKANRIPFYLNVVRLPPTYMPVLIGQRSDTLKVFSNSGVFEIIKSDGSYSSGGKVELPAGGNVYNFAWLPGDGRVEARLVVLNDQEKLAVYSEKGSRIYLSDEKFSGSAVGIDSQTSMPGMSKNSKDIPRQYYIPMRMLAIDIERRGEPTLLVNKPISVSAQYFDRYRYFPEGEIQSLFWDGVGMNLLWKTRRIKGSVVDFAVSDLTGAKSSLDLVVCVNTHPGTLGVGGQKTVILRYPMDLSQTDPNTSPYADY
jgi:hypothetical protein